MLTYADVCSLRRACDRVRQLLVLVSRPRRRYIYSIHQHTSAYVSIRICTAYFSWSVARDAGIYTYYICIYISVYIYLLIYTVVYLPYYTYTYVYIYIYNIYIYVYVYIYVYMYVRMYVCMYICMYIYAALHGAEALIQHLLLLTYADVC
jgi:hypothetical protein